MHILSGGRDPAVVLGFSPRIGQRTLGLKVNGSVLPPAVVPVCTWQVRFQVRLQLKALGWCPVGERTRRVWTTRCSLNPMFHIPTRPGVPSGGRSMPAPFAVAMPQGACCVNGAILEGSLRRNCPRQPPGWFGEGADGNGFGVWIDPNKTGVQRGQTALDSLGPRWCRRLSLPHDISPTHEVLHRHSQPRPDS